MQSSIVALVAFAMLLTFVQCKHHKTENVAEYIIKQGLLSGGRSYEIKSKENAESRFTIRNELFHVGKQLFLSQDGKELYIVKHEIFNLMSTWTISDAVSHKVLGTIKNQLKFIGSEIEANGEFGHYEIKGKFLDHEFKILKDGHKVAKIEKKRFHLHDTYGLKVYGDADQALMVLFTIIVDEIREH